MVLGALYHGAVALFVKQWRNLSGQVARLVLAGHSGPDELLQMFQLQHRLVIVLLQVCELHVDNQDNFLLEVVKGNHLVKEHQVHVLKILRVLPIQAEGGLRILQIVIGEIPHQPPGEGGQVVKAGAPVLFQYLPDVLPRVTALKGQHPHFHPSVLAGKLQSGIKSQKGVPSPFLPVRHRFQQIAVTGNVFENPQYRNGCFDVRQNLCADRHNAVTAPGSQFFYLI